MSLNIQTADGLLEIGGNVTKEKVISALGYSPADEEDLPNITEDESGELTVADQSGNVIMTVDAEGIHTTEIIANGIALGETLSKHTSNSSAHVSSSDRSKWDNKSDFSGAYADLLDAPNIVENESGNLTVNDESGNTILKVDANGLETTVVTAKNIIADNVDIGVKLDEHNESIKSLNSHTTNTTIHITSNERTLWNNKSDFSGDYKDLTNAPDITEDETGELSYADGSGNVIAKINSDGFETTQVIANTILVNGADVGSHISNSNIHITADERTKWNAKATTTYVDEKVADLVDSSPETLNTLNELAAALGDDPNFATTVAGQIGLKADQASLDTHINNKSNPHNVTKSQVGLGNVNNTSDADKPVSTAQREALNSLKDELSESIVSESKEWTIVDNSGNIIAKVDSSGLETIAVTVESAVVNGRDVEDELDNKVNKVSGKGLSTNDFTTAYKNKLDGIAEGANNYTYTLPVATSSVLGGVKSGTDITVDSSGNVSVVNNSHSHTISNISDFPTSLKNPSALTIQGNGTTLTNGTYDGSAAKTVNITPASIGAAASSHGNHVPATETANNAKFLRNDNSWQTVTPANIGAVPTTRKVNNKALSADITLTASDVGAAAASHTSDTTAHITSTERSKWNAKSDFSGDYYDLTNAPDIREDGSGDLVIADPSGKIVFRSDGNGFETTTLTAQTISLAGNDVGAAINNKVDKVTGKGLSTNDFTTTYKNKLDGIATGANKYTHPSHTAKSSGLYKITVDSSGHVSAATAVAKADITGLGIPAQDTVYTHPTHTAKSNGLYKVTVDSSGHVSGTAAVAKADITALGIPAQDTTYSAVTTSAAGLMSAADKTKLDGVCTNLVNGSAVGSLRSIDSTAESSSYTMGERAVALGYSTMASGKWSFAMGGNTEASGNYAVALGGGAVSSGLHSMALGTGNVAKGDYSYSFGLHTTANKYGQMTIGLYNTSDTDGSDTAYSASTDAFIIGNGNDGGTSTSFVRSNAFRVAFNGSVYGGTYNSSGADYAEFFEWADGNPNNEDRIGHFVTLAEEGTIKIASANDEILGVISGNGSVVGDAHDDVWQGMWMRDIYGRILYEDVEVERENEDGEKSIVIEHRMKLNPDYDPSQPYIPRSQRPEWDVVGLLGKLVLIDDGTCIAGGYCACNDSGIATASKTGYKVLNRLDETHIKVLIK